jgi:hypothetical protein
VPVWPLLLAVMPGLVWFLAVSARPSLFSTFLFRGQEEDEKTCSFKNKNKNSDKSDPFKCTVKN